MLKKVVFKWIKDALMGVGASLLAAGFMGIVAPGTHPMMIAVTLVVGVTAMVGSLVVSLIAEANNP